MVYYCDTPSMNGRGMVNGIEMVLESPLAWLKQISESVSKYLFTDCL